MSIVKPLYKATETGNVEFTEAEYAEYETSLPQVETSHQEHLERAARVERDAKLAATDWTQVADAPVDQAAWATYRQSLRAVPEQAGFPNTIDWPTSP